MGRTSVGIGAGALLLFLATGCSTSHPWTWPWEIPERKPEEYVSPPLADSRYSDPQHLPKYLTTPGLKKITDPDAQAPPSGFTTGPSGGRQSPGGNFAN